MELTGWVVLVPLSLGPSGYWAGLLTGQHLGSPFRHYWVLFCSWINLVATIVLLLYMQTLEHLGDVAAAAAMSSGARGLRDPSPALHAAAALLLLVVATTLAVYKPRGITWYGHGG